MGCEGTEAIPPNSMYMLQRFLTCKWRSLYFVRNGMASDYRACKLGIEYMGASRPIK